jgi:hypothetical protein
MRRRKGQHGKQSVTWMRRGCVRAALYIAHRTDPSNLDERVSFEIPRCPDRNNFASRAE